MNLHKWLDILTMMLAFGLPAHAFGQLAEENAAETAHFDGRQSGVDSTGAGLKIGSIVARNEV